MEQSEGYKQLVAKIDLLEQEVSSCEKIIKDCEQTATTAEMEIVKHFEECTRVLALRRETLLKQVSEKVNTQKKRVEESRKKLISSADVCKSVLKAGIKIYEVNESSANDIWKSTQSIPSVVQKVQIKATLQTQLMESIKLHGKVDEIINGTRLADFTKAESVETLALKNADGSRPSIKLDSPSGICLNPHDQCLYVAGENKVLKISLQGNISTFAIVDRPYAIAMNYTEKIFYVSSYSNNIITKITANGVATHFAGSVENKFSDKDGTGSEARFKHPAGIAVNQRSGSLYVCDFDNSLIRKITPKGIVSTFAGSSVGSVDGIKTKAKFDGPHGICYNDSDQSFLIADLYGNQIRKMIITTGRVSTLCKVEKPCDIAIAPDGTILVTTETNKIFAVWLEGEKYKAREIAGNGDAADVDGKPETCCFDAPHGIVIHKQSGTCFVADVNNDSIRKITF